MLENNSTYYIKRIKLINVRCFRTLDLNILGNSSTPRMRTVMIGKNGTCKSTVLRCIALGLCDRSDADSLLSEPFGLIVTEGCKSAEIIIDISEKTRPKETFTLKTIIERVGGKEVIEKKLGSSKFYPIFVGGYGAARATDGQDEFRDYRTLDSVYTLFKNCGCSANESVINFNSCISWMGVISKFFVHFICKLFVNACGIPP